MKCFVIAIAVVCGACTNSSLWVSAIPPDAPAIHGHLVKLGDRCSLRIPTGDGGAVSFYERNNERCEHLFKIAEHQIGQR